MFDFEKFSSARFYVAETVEKVIEFSPQGIDVENISKVLSLSVDAKCESADPYSGYAEIAGRANFRLIYLDKENVAKGVDYNADFTARVDGDFEEGDNLVCDIHVAEAEVGAKDSLTLTAALEICVKRTRSEELELLTTAEDCYVSKREATIPAFIAQKVATSEFSDEQNVGGEIDGVLSINASVAVTEATATEGGASLKSTVFAVVAYVKDGGIASQNFEIPLEDEISLEGATEEDAIKVQAGIKNAKVILQGVTGDNVLRIEGEVVYKIQAYRCSKTEIIDDVFMLSNELLLERANRRMNCYLGSVYQSEAVSGIALLGDNRPAAESVVALPYARCYVAKTYVSEDGEITAEGVVNTDVIYTDENGYNSVRTEIPFSISLGRAEEGVEYSADCTVTGINAKLRREREFEIDVNLAVALAKYQEKECEYISSVELGEERQKNTSALSMYIAGEGEEMLDVCKALYAMPDEILAQNPDLVFPMKEGEEVVYFRNLK
ncbi:MAG: DUF3794 domain-containing protein [Clostridia bacterium]|nr:DUF3794 domain-containing protein [Clostridia bacterium]